MMPMLPAISIPPKFIIGIYIELKICLRILVLTYLQIQMYRTTPFEILVPTRLERITRERCFGLIDKNSSIGRMRCFSPGRRCSLPGRRVTSDELKWADTQAQSSSRVVGTCMKKQGRGQYHEEFPNKSWSLDRILLLNSFQIVDRRQSQSVMRILIGKGYPTDLLLKTCSLTSADSNPWIYICTILVRRQSKSQSVIRFGRDYIFRCVERVWR